MVTARWAVNAGIPRHAPASNVVPSGRRTACSDGTAMYVAAVPNGRFHCPFQIQTTPELQEAVDLGIVLFAGEAELEFESFLKDVQGGRARPIYNHMDALPNLQGTTIPYLPRRLVQRYDGVLSSFDAGRGCPFQCSFCTIINVQGRKSRWRDADDIERIVKENAKQGISRFFVTDDNFARNRNWEPIFDRMIE